MRKPDFSPDFGRNIVVIGGSAGGVEAILDLVRTLSADFPAAVFVVIHTTPSGKGELAQLLERVGRLKCALAVDGEPIQSGRIYLARPDHHLLLEPGKVRSVRGPRENRHRPAIDPLFRSAAVAYGSRVIGIILSGTLDDGAAGLGMVKKLGGIALVQHPEDAIFPDMPRNAMHAVAVDYAKPVKELPGLLCELMRERAVLMYEASEADKIEAEIAANRLISEEKMREVASPSIYNCPDCNGALFEYTDAGMVRFRCVIGHALSGLTLLEEQSKQIEEALSMALRSLSEKQSLYGLLGKNYEMREMSRAAEEMKGKARALDKHTEVIKNLLASLD